MKCLNQAGCYGKLHEPTKEETMALVTPVQNDYIAQASGFINSIAVSEIDYLERYVPLETRQRELKARQADIRTELAEVEAEIAKLGPRKHKLDKLVHRFYKWAERRRGTFLAGASRTIKTGSGLFSWKTSSKEALICPKGDHVLAEKLVAQGRIDLLDWKLRKDDIKAAMRTGGAKVKPSEGYIVKRERMVIAPTGLRPITFCEGEVTIAE